MEAKAAGRISEVQEAADVYSLGAILYAALTFGNASSANNPACVRFTNDGKYLIASDKSTGAMIAIDCSSGRTICALTETMVEHSFKRIGQDRKLVTRPAALALGTGFVYLLTSFDIIGSG